MINFLKRFFPIKVRSIDEFIDVTNSRKCKTVKVVPTVFYPDGGPSDMRSRELFGGLGWTNLGERTYYVQLEASTADGRRVVCRARQPTQVYMKMSISDMLWTRPASAIKLFLITEKIVGELRSRLPDVEIQWTAPDGRQMDSETLARLHTDAKKLGVAV